MFRSSQRRTWFRRLSDVVWPRHGFRRAWNYRMCRLSRLRVCPHRISLGFAAGAFASFTPFIGFHFLLAAALALVMRGNLLASAAGTVVGNPLTFPFIWLATFQIGSAIVGPPAGHVAGMDPIGLSLAEANDWQGYWELLGDAIWPMSVGAIPLGLAGAAISYAFCFWSLGKVRRTPASRSAAAEARRR